MKVLPEATDVLAIPDPHSPTGFKTNSVGALASLMTERFTVTPPVPAVTVGLVSFVAKSKDKLVIALSGKAGMSAGTRNLTVPGFEVDPEVSVANTLLGVPEGIIPEGP